MVRWWWFGPGVTKSEVTRELEEMKSAGIGGVEIATLYPLALDDSQTGFHNFAFLSDEHIDALRFAAEEAKKLGLRVDVTLGSGWPFGGAHISVTQAAGAMRVENVEIPSGSKSIAIPGIATGERLEAVFLAPGSRDAPGFRDAKQIQSPVIENGRLQISTELSAFQVAVFFISSRTGMTVKRPAIGAEGFVLDHYDQTAIEAHLRAVGDLQRAPGLGARAPPLGVRRRLLARLHRRALPERRRSGSRTRCRVRNRPWAQQIPVRPARAVHQGRQLDPANHPRIHLHRCIRLRHAVEGAARGRTRVLRRLLQCLPGRS